MWMDWSESLKMIQLGERHFNTNWTTPPKEMLTRILFQKYCYLEAEICWTRILRKSVWIILTDLKKAWKIIWKSDIILNISDEWQELKLAMVILIYKTDKKQMIQSYIPILVISYFSKVLEKSMFNHVIAFLEHNNILYDFQFGFRSHHSTHHAIITMVETLSDALDTWKTVVGIFLD